MTVRETSIPGVLEIEPFVATDSRGCFVKTFQSSEFSTRGLVSDFMEEYYSVSRRGVIRGLHFQTPPMEYFKLVLCISGAVLDAIVDLRVGSPTFLRHLTFELDADRLRMLYLPPGIAHGFYVRSLSATLLYHVTTPHSPECDHGIAWNSVGIPWPKSEIILSERDRMLPPMTRFNSPFRYHVAYHDGK